MNPLPFLISIPHGGTQIPIEASGRTTIDNYDLFDDADPFTQEIFNVRPHVRFVVQFNVYRAFVDVNRSENMLPPEFPDGLIKSSTCYGKQIYKKGFAPDKVLSKKWIKTYYIPYHQKLKLYSNSPDIKLGLDCHSMASIAPQISPDTGQKRPLFCLGNVDNTSCDLDTVNELAASIQENFCLEQNDVSINKPFKGGYITRTYGNNPIPWIQIEMNRELYLAKKYFDRQALTVDLDRIKQLRTQFKNALNDFSKSMNWTS